MKRKTIADLIEELKKLNPNYYWHGWDDESLIITEDQDGMKLVAYIEPIHE